MVSSEGSSATPLPPQSPKQFGVTKPLSKAGPSETDLQRTLDLEKFLVDVGLYESKEEAAKREAVLGRIKEIVKDWVKQLTRLRGYTDQMVEDANAVILTFGSYRLGVHGPGADIDTLCVGPSYVNREEDFFFILHDILAEMEEVTELQPVPDAHVPVMKLKFNGVSIDLLYASISLLVVPEDLDISDVSVLYNVDEPTLRSLNGCRVRVLSFCQGIAVGRTFAALKNYQVDGNKEMTAIGLMNMAGSCSSCFVTSGSFSRSAVNYKAGAQTVVSNIIMASTVLVTLLFLMPLFHYTPTFILAAIIITAVIGLIDYQAAFRLWKVDKLDFLACLCSFLGVLIISVPLGLSIAVGVSVFKILLHVTRPTTVVLGNIPETQIYQSLGRYGEALRVPSFLILAVESPILFANSTYLQERILRWVREEENDKTLTLMFCKMI